MISSSGSLAKLDGTQGVIDDPKEDGFESEEEGLGDEEIVD